MATDEPEDEGGGIPEWVVTFGDMMSLLLTFFIMLVSMSEIKQEEMYQALVESMRRQFGHEASMVSLVPGSSKPRNSALQKMATMGRARRANIMRGGDKVRAPVGDHPRVQTLRSAKNPIAGGVIHFAEGKAELTEKDKQQLQIIAQELGGKPQKIEIRGHTSRKPLPKNSPYKNHWELAFARCQNTRDFLESVGIAPQRIRLGVAADHEPVREGIDPIERKKTSRVEVFILDERLARGEDAKATPDHTKNQE